jgi:hypothetical protein
MSATLARFFGADPGSVGPARLVKAAEAFWSRYHAWSQLQVALGPSGATVSMSPGAADPLVCALVEGSLGRIAELGGGREVQSGHPACAAAGAAECLFELRWT